MPYVKEIKVGQQVSAQEIDWAGYWREIIGMSEVYKRLWVFTDPMITNKRVVLLYVKEEGQVWRCVHNDFKED